MGGTLICWNVPDIVKGYSVDSIVELIQRAAHKDTVVIPILNVYGTGPRIQKLVPGVTVLDGCIYIVGFVSGTGEITQMGKIFRLVYGAHRDEKIRILRGELASDNTPEGAAKRAELEAAVRPFEMHDVSQPWPELLRKGKETIARLSE